MSGLDNTLRNQVGLVTGASGGIGHAVSLELARMGCTLCLVGRDQNRLKGVALAVEECGRQAVIAVADLSRTEGIDCVLDIVKENYRNLDILIHSSGAFCYSRIERAELQDFRRQLEVNVVAPYALTKALLPMLRGSKGQVVFVNSSIVQNPSVGTIQYAATKHALKGIADGLRKEVNEDGIRVLTVYPGRIATPMQEQVCGAEGRDYHPEKLLQPKEVAAVVVHALNLPRTAEVTDIHLRPAVKG